MATLIQNTLFTGKNLIHLDKVDSTNTYAKQLTANSTPKNGTVILADEQYAGRGLAGNIWQSEAGMNLTFSIIYDTNFLKAEEQFFLNMAVPLGVRAAVDMAIVENQELRIKRQEAKGKRQEEEILYNNDLRLTTHDLRLVTIKWPNDIYVGKKKIAGILIENSIQGQYLKNSVIGIGINVNQEKFGETLKATSLYKEKGIKTELHQFLCSVLLEIENYFLGLRQKQVVSLKEEYISNLFLYKSKAQFKSKDEAFEAMIIDVSPSGKLILMTDTGKVAFNFKEIEYVLDS